MKKYTIFVVVVLMGFSAQGMQKMSRLAQAGLRASQGAQQTRSIAHLPDVVRLDQMLAQQDRRWFALQGAVALYNGSITQALQSDATKKVTSRLFNQHLGEPIRFTIAPGNPAIALNAERISELIAMRREGKLTEEIFLESETFKKWREAYTGNKKTFRQEAKRLVKELNEMDDEVAAQLLTAALYYKSRADEPLLQCVKIAGLSVEDENALEKPELSTREKMLMRLLDSRRSMDIAVLMPEEITGFKNRCAEKTLWAIINLILYNHTEKKLDLSLLPESIQATCNPVFVAFLEKHSDVHTPGYYEKAHKDFLAMVEELPFITYEARGKNAPVFPDAVQIGKLLQYFLGTQAENCVAICKELQRVDFIRTITCEENSGKKPKEQMVHFFVKYKDEPKKDLSGVFTYDGKHASFAFDPKEMLSHKELLQVAVLEKSEGHKPGTYVKVPNGYLHRVCNWDKASPEDVKKIMTEYSLTFSDLTELSQGLGFHKDALIHTVAASGNIKVLHYLLKMGCKTSLKNSQGYTPFDCCGDAFDATEDEQKKEDVSTCCALLGVYRSKEVMVDFFNKVGRAIVLNSGRW